MQLENSRGILWVIALRPRTLGEPKRSETWSQHMAAKVINKSPMRSFVKCQLKSQYKSSGWPRCTHSHLQTKVFTWFYYVSTMSLQLNVFTMYFLLDVITASRHSASTPRASFAMPALLIRSRMAGALARFLRRRSSKVKLKSKKGILETLVRLGASWCIWKAHVFHY